MKRMALFEKVVKESRLVYLQTKLNKANADVMKVKREWDNMKGKIVEQDKEMEASRAHMEQKLQGLEVSAEKEKVLLEPQSRQIKEM